MEWPQFDVPDWGTTTTTTKFNKIKNKTETTESRSIAPQAKEITQKKKKNKKNKKKPQKLVEDTLVEQEDTVKDVIDIKRKKSKEEVEEQQRKKRRTESPLSTQEVKAVSSVSTGDVAGRLPLSKLQQKMKDKLQGARFRWLNEKLYTTTGTDAFKLFQKDSKLFDEYHSGFRHQVDKWPKNPVDIFIAYVKSKPTKLVVADFGCGEAKLAQNVPNKVHSFDLVAANEHITACDIANVPLPNNVIDIGIFSLSLMGTNYLDFIKEAHRVMKLRGVLKIAEVESRIGDIDKFIATVSSVGFKIVSKDMSYKMFVLFEFVKTEEKTAETVEFQLKACKYKKR